MISAQAGNLLGHIRRWAGLPAGDDGVLLARFAADGDEAAFAALVRRHADGVWGVCRRLLKDEADAEDAFQATFVVLARKAGSLRKSEAIASWLYGVAFRVAMNARRMAARRRRLEEQASRRTIEQPIVEAGLRELHRLLDAEVDNLPEKNRLPFVLCCLEGKSKSEAARILGWKPGTVSSRLAEARRRLREGLMRRGVTLSAALTVLALKTTCTQAAAPAALVHTAGRVAGGTVAANLDALTHGVTPHLTGLKSKLLAGVCLSFVLIGMGTFALPGEQPEKTPAAQAQRDAPIPEDKLPPMHKSDRDLIQGTWKVLEANHNGKILSNELLTGEDQIWRISDGRITIRYADGSTKALVFRLDPSQKPKAVDVMIDEESTTRYLGIYVLDGDSLKFAYSRNVAPTATRPEAFDSRDFLECRGRRMFLLQRQKPPAETEWGVEENGLQCRLRADKTVWKAGQVPAFWVDVRYRGQRTDIGIIAEEGAHQLQLGKIVHERRDKDLGLVRILKPGARIDDIPFSLTESWLHGGSFRDPPPARKLRAVDENAKLKLTPGRHIIRVAVYADIGKGAEWIRALSNPVEITIEAAGEKPEAIAPQASAKAVHNGLALTIRLNKRVFGAEDAIDLSFELRNESTKPMYVGDGFLGPDYHEVGPRRHFEVLATPGKEKPLRFWSGMATEGVTSGIRKVFKLAPGEAYTGSIRLSAGGSRDKGFASVLHEERGGYWATADDKKHVWGQDARYSVALRYQIDPKSHGTWQPPDGFKDNLLWKGTITSQPLMLEIAR